MNVLHIETPVHGRVLFRPAAEERLLVGFHGFGETAEVHLAELEKIDGVQEWSVAAVQALHPFYTRSGIIVASWMTSLDRELAITDNVEYIRRALRQLPPAKTLVFAGFSQGVAMAFRAAAYAGANPAGLIALGGDVPPEVVSDGAKLPPVLLARGRSDDWYTEEKFKQDINYLEASTKLTPVVFEGGHEFSDPFRAVAADFLRSVR